MIPTFYHSVGNAIMAARNHLKRAGIDDFKIQVGLPDDAWREFVLTMPDLARSTLGIKDEIGVAGGVVYRDHPESRNGRVEK